MAGLKGSKTETAKPAKGEKLTLTKAQEAIAAKNPTRKGEYAKQDAEAKIAKPVKGAKADAAHASAQAKADRAAPGKPEGDKKSRESKGVTVIAGIEAKPCRAGSKQALLIDLLSRKKGVTMAELVEALSAEGKPWNEQAIRAGFYWDVKNKGYGVRTETAKDGTQTFFLALPEGMSAPLPHTVAGSAKPEPKAEKPAKAAKAEPAAKVSRGAKK